MVLSPAGLVLLVYLAGAVVADCRRRRIPWWWNGAGALGLGAVSLCCGGRWSWAGLAVGVLVGLAGGLPRGDGLALAVLGAALGVERILWVGAGVYAVGVVLLLLLGPRRSLLTHPFFPYIALVCGMVLLIRG